MSDFHQCIRPSAAESVRDAESARLRFTIPADFFFCQGHFPDQPLVPGAVISAWMLEAAALCTGNQNAGTAQARLRNLKFRHPLTPGDPVAIEAVSVKEGFRVTVHSRDRLCADADFLL